MDHMCWLGSLCHGANSFCIVNSTVNILFQKICLVQMY